MDLDLWSIEVAGSVILPIFTRKILSSEVRQGQDTLNTLYFTRTCVLVYIMLVNFPVLLSY